MNIRYSDSASNTAAFALIAEGWNELVQDGHTPDYGGVCPVNDKSEVLYVVSAQGDIVGVIVYQRNEANGNLVLQLGYVEPSSRRQHIFTKLFETLKNAARNLGSGVIVTPIAESNTVARKVIEKLGADPVVVEYETVVS